MRFPDRCTCLSLLHTARCYTICGRCVSAGLADNLRLHAPRAVVRTAVLAS
jgi:hypothetical protein